MRQIFSSPRLENVEGVAKLLRDAGIEIKVSDDRGYKQVSRREFSYSDRKSGGGNFPAIWVIKSEDYKRARELLRDAGLIDIAPVPSYLPGPLQAKQTAQADPQKRLVRIKMTLLFVLGGVVTLTILKMVLTR